VRSRSARPAPGWRCLAPSIALLALALFGASTASASTIAWKPCRDAEKGLECARVQVPLDWSNPAGPKISLAVIRRPASRPAKRLGTLFVNFGGPGVAGVATVKSSGPLLDRLGHGRFDIVSWDPRGTGESTHISCFADHREEARFWGPFAVPVTAAEWRRRMPRAVAFARRCTARNRQLLRFDSTADTARDLDRLRELLGEPKLNYRGVSYGTFIGQTYANLFPETVRAMVLDGNVNPFEFTRSVVSSLGSGIVDGDLVQDKFLALCADAGPRRCALARGGSPRRRFDRLVARLKGGPIPAPGAEPPRLTYGDLLTRIFLAGGSPVGWPLLAEELEEAVRGDGSAIAETVQAQGPALERALNSAVGLQCADKPVRPRLDQSDWPRALAVLTRASTYGGPFQAWLLWAPCSAWTVPAAHRYTGPWDAVTPDPVLVIGTRYDPRTAYRSSVLVAKTLGNAVLLTHDGYGHTSDADPSACVERDVARYLIALATPPPGTVCRSDREPFSPRFGEPLSGR
jgi:pimeloyl-ACP methyl ester carboxylesterase